MPKAIFRAGGSRNPTIARAVRWDAVPISQPGRVSFFLPTCLRVRLRMSWMGDSAEEQISHGEEDHGLGDVEAFLVVTDEAAISCQPTDGAFDNPAAWNN